MGNRSLKSALQAHHARRMLLIAAGVVGTIYLLFSFFFGEMGLIQSFKIGRTRGDLEREIQELRVDNEHLRKDIERLWSDPETIEGLARERLGMVRPGERVYRFKETPKKGDETSKNSTGRGSGE